MDLYRQRLQTQTQTQYFSTNVLAVNEFEYDFAD